MQRSTPTLCVAVVAVVLSTLARGQTLTSLSPEITTEGAAAERTSNPPELTLEEAVAFAVANNSSLRNSSLETVQAANDLAASRTKRFAKTQVTALGAQLPLLIRGLYFEGWNPSGKPLRIRHGDEFLEVLNADFHDLRDTQSTREIYVAESHATGIKRNRKRVLVAREEIVAVSRLVDVVYD